MFQNHHIVPQTVGGNVLIRHGRAGGVSTGAYWDTGCLTNGAYHGGTASIIVEPNTNITLNAPTVYYNANIHMNSSFNFTGGTNIPKRIYYSGAPITAYLAGSYYLVDIYPANVMSIGDGSIRYFRVTFYSTTFYILSGDYPYGCVDIMIDYSNNTFINKNIYMGDNTGNSFNLQNGYFSIYYNSSAGQTLLTVNIFPYNSF
jgi:hypothetical protein